MAGINLNFFKGMFKAEPVSFLGVDIGTSSIKLVELSKEKERAKLATYGEAGTYYSLERLTEMTSFKSQQIADTKLTQLLKDLLKATGAVSKTAVFSLPLSSSFTTIIEFPKMDPAEIEKAIEYEARQYVPIPLSEVKLSWNIVGKTSYDMGDKDKRIMAADEKTEVLLIAVPNEVISRYQTIAKSVGLEISGMELESYSAVRSVLGNDKMTAIMVDMGARITDISLIEKGIIKMNHNLEVGGADITRIISQSMNIPMIRAEELKKEFGLQAQGGEKEISNLMHSVLDLIIIEIQRMSEILVRKGNRKIEKIILVGGTAILPGVTQYFTERTGISTAVGNPFFRVMYPDHLDSVIKQIGPGYCTAVGLALRDFA